MTIAFNDAAHACSQIVRSQQADTERQLQPPEPWVGQLDVAPILFVASNPSIDETSSITAEASDEQLWESHHLAFGGGERAYIEDGIRALRPDGSVVGPVRYWAVVQSRARELMTQAEVRPGIGYALTEVVHCKSKHEIGVADAVASCIGMHLEPIFVISPAVVVVAMGSFARRALMGSNAQSVAMRMLGGRSRTIVGLSHPAAFGGGKTFAQVLSTEQLVELRSSLAGASAAQER